MREQTRELQLRSSRGLAIWMGLPPLGAAFIVGWLWNSVPGVAIALLVAGLGVRTVWQKVLLRGSTAPRFIRLRDGGEGSVVLRGGKAHSVRARDAHVSRWMVVLRLEKPWWIPVGGTVFIPAPLLPGADFRVLRLWALWGRLEAPDVGTVPSK